MMKKKSIDYIGTHIFFFVVKKKKSGKLPTFYDLKFDLYLLLSDKRRLSVKNDFPNTHIFQFAFVSCHHFFSSVYFN